MMKASLPRLQALLLTALALLLLTGTVSAQQSARPPQAVFQAAPAAEVIIVGGLGDIAEAVLRGRGQPMTVRGGLYLVIDGSDHQRTVDNLVRAFDGLRIERVLIDQNVANADTQNSRTGEPYRAQVVKVLPDGSVTAVSDPSEFRYVHAPGNPNALEDGPHKGCVPLPNVNIQQQRTEARRNQAEQAAVMAALHVLEPNLVVGVPRPQAR